MYMGVVKKIIYNDQKQLLVMPHACMTEFGNFFPEGDNHIMVYIHKVPSARSAV